VTPADYEDGRPNPFQVAALNAALDMMAADARGLELRESGEPVLARGDVCDQLVGATGCRTRMTATPVVTRTQRRGAFS
jgi:hypothetical protein